MKRKTDLSIFYDMEPDRLFLIYRAGILTLEEYEQITIHDAETALAKYKKRDKLMTAKAFPWRTFLVLILAFALACAYVFFAGSKAASAHTPAISVTCDGVVLHATNYDYSKANTWVVTLDGVETSGTFGSSLDKVIPVPQDGKTTTVGAQISDQDGTPEYSEAYSGAVGPCGTPPVVIPEKPAPVVTTGAWEFQSADCENWISTDGRWIRTADWTLVDNVWVLNSTYSEIVETQTRPAVVGECFVSVPPVLTPPVVDIPEVVPPADLPEPPVAVSDVVIPEVGEAVSYDALAETGQTEDRLWATGGLIGSFLLIGTGLLLWIRYEKKSHDVH